MPIAFVLIGPPGSGKTDLGVAIQERFFCGKLSMSSELRSRPEPEVLEAMKSGHLVVNHIAIDTFKQAWSKVKDKGQNMIFDGVIRTVTQEQAIKEELIASGYTTIFVNISVPLETCFERMIGRKREDDVPEVISVRFNVFQRYTSKVIDFVDDDIVIVDGKLPLEDMLRTAIFDLEELVNGVKVEA
jgi:adenylate kinase family enzyme